MLPESGPAAWNPVNTAWEYDPAKDEWKALAPMPTKRGAATAAAAGGKLYVTGGANSLPGVTENGIHPARPHRSWARSRNTTRRPTRWRTRRSLLLPRNHHVTAGAGGRLYVIGGRVGSAFITGTSNNVDLVEMYDPATDLWTSRARMPTARSAMGWGVYKDQYIITAGGEGQDQRALFAFKSVEAYDPTVNRWMVLPSMARQRHGLAVGVVGNRLLCGERRRPVGRPRARARLGRRQRGAGARSGDQVSGEIRMSSHRALCLAVGALLALAAVPAHAQTYPTKPVTIVVPLAAGTGMDTIARLYGEQLSQIARQADRGREPAGRLHDAGDHRGRDARRPTATRCGIANLAAPLATNPVLYKKVDYDPEQATSSPIALLREVAVRAGGQSGAAGAHRPGADQATPRRAQRR